jgi:hypothetical protein
LHKELRDLHTAQRNQLEEIWKAYQNEQTTLLVNHHQEQIQMKQKHGKESEIAALKAEHEEEKKILSQKHIREMDVSL